MKQFKNYEFFCEIHEALEELRIAEDKVNDAFSAISKDNQVVTLTPYKLFILNEKFISAIWTPEFLSQYTWWVYEDSKKFLVRGKLDGKTYAVDVRDKQVFYVAVTTITEDETDDPVYAEDIKAALFNNGVPVEKIKRVVYEEARGNDTGYERSTKGVDTFWTFI